MSEHLEKLAACRQITEWVTAWDERLVRVTGLQPPVDGSSLREQWSVNKEGWLTMQSEVQDLMQVVKGLLVPQAIQNRVTPSFAWSGFEGDTIRGTVSLEFKEQEDWRQCLPANSETLVFDRRGVKGHAAVALCGKVAGMAVISMEHETGQLDFAVQAIRADKFTAIVGG